MDKAIAQRDGTQLLRKVRGMKVSATLLAFFFAAMVGGAQAAPVTTTLFGHLPDGQAVHLFTLTNSHGLSARISDYGGIVVALKTPDRDGKMGDILLGFDTLEGYIKKSPYFGALIGRYANRIAGGRFTLDGKTYQLAKNAGPNNLHGGPIGFDKVVWNARPFADRAGPGLILTHVSPDGDQGFPGKLTVTVTYRLTDDNRLTLDYRAITTKATVVNLTFHGYFNLSADFRHTVLDQVLRINAANYTPVNAALVPTGKIVPVADTPFDFTHAKAIGHDIAAADPQLKRTGGYDQNFVLNKSAPGALTLAARASDPSSGRVMTVWTTQPGLQFYTANSLNGLEGKGVAYPNHGAFCLEAEHFPDSPNHPNFPSTVLRPGQIFTAHTEYDFSVAK
jgi:aldose 1-epimerase